jgi:hypothetical protein
MKAVTVIPGKVGSLSLADVPEPSPLVGSVVVEANCAVGEWDMCTNAGYIDDDIRVVVEFDKA